MELLKSAYVTKAVKKRFVKYVNCSRFVLSGTPVFGAIISVIIINSNHFFVKLVVYFLRLSQFK